MSEIVKYTDNRYDVLLQIWEESVRSSHDFLSERDVEFFKPIVYSSFKELELYIIRDDMRNIAAFMGLSETTIEMLFVRPSEQGKGYGSQLVDFATRVMGRDRVDVNEQNERAYRFYLKKGFHVIGRDEMDPYGKHFPILYLQL